MSGIDVHIPALRFGMRTLPLNSFLMQVANLDHLLPLRFSMRTFFLSAERAKKKMFGGADESRTRDLLRDRQAC